MILLSAICVYVIVHALYLAQVGPLAEISSRTALWVSAGGGLGLVLLAILDSARKGGADAAQKETEADARASAPKAEGVPPPSGAALLEAERDELRDRLTSLTLDHQELRSECDRLRRESQAKAAAPRESGDSSAQVLQFLARLQEKGRLIDFLMEDLTGRSDQQLASVARVVHQGARDVLRQYLNLKAVFPGREGESVSIPEQYDPLEIRLIGKADRMGGRGALVHHGWKVDEIKLPTIRPGTEKASMVLQPAEVEVR